MQRCKTHFCNKMKSAKERKGFMDHCIGLNCRTNVQMDEESKAERTCTNGMEWLHNHWAVLYCSRSLSSLIVCTVYAVEKYIRFISKSFFIQLNTFHINIRHFEFSIFGVNTHWRLCTRDGRYISLTDVCIKYRYQSERNATDIFFGLTACFLWRLWWGVGKDLVSWAEKS